MATDADLMSGVLRDVPDVFECDVLLLQEVVRATSDGPSAAETLARTLGRYSAFASPAPGSTLSGLGIVSKYPLSDVRSFPLKAFDLGFRSRSRIALGATVSMPSGPVRIMNTHLDTRINTRDRLKQLTPVIQQANTFAGPTIIGGDFNTNNNMWIQHAVPLPYSQKQSGAVQDLMAQHGFVTPFANTGATHKMFGMRLDWVYAKSLEPWAAGIERISFSDHHAIWARFEVR